MIKKLLISGLCLACFFMYTYTKAQTSTYSTTLPVFKPVPTSSEAHSLGKYGDIPVGLYTGVPDVTIPIYTLETKGIKIPITLSYHAGGIKVEELASNVGLGWALNFGGSITTSIHGAPDFHGWLTEMRKLPQSGSIQNTWGVYDMYEADTTYQLLLGASRGIIDTQPDLFYVNMNGRSFKYYYAQNGTIFPVPYQRVKFTTGQILTDENDTKYTFGAEELISTNYSHSGDDLGDPTYSHSNYFISEITTAHKDTISYEYETYSYNFDNQPSQTRYASVGTTGCAVALPDPTLTESESYITGKRIKKMKANNGIEINFTYGTSRQDLTGTYALTAIEIKNWHTNTVLFTYTLNHSYFGSGGTTADDYRLKLTSIQKAGDNPYLFEYTSNYMPNRLSKDQDHWGFFNSAGNTTLLPVDAAHYFTTGADRNPVEQHAKVGALTKITYPTAGYSTFDYELHQFVQSSVTKLLGGLRIKSITDHPLTGIPKTTYYEYTAMADFLKIVPEYVYIHEVYYSEVNTNTYLNCDFYAQSSGSIVPLGAKGNPAVYTEVKVYTEAATKGFTHHRFSHYGNSSGPGGFPFTPVINYDWVDGLPIETTDFLWDAVTSAYRPVKKITNQYKTVYGGFNGNLSNPHEYEHRGAKITLQKYPIKPYPIGPPVGARGPEFIIEFFNLYSSWSYPTSTREILYDPADSNKKVITDTKFFYDNPVHSNITRQEITKNDTEKYKLLFVYPQDYNSSYPYNSSPVVEKRIMTNNGSTDMLIDAELTTYLNQPGTFPYNYYNLNISAPVTPSAIPVYSGSSVNSNYEKRREYVYDAKYNVVSFVSDANSSSYQWGYRSQYPVAEIRNAATNEFYHQNAEEETGFTGPVKDNARAHTGNYSMRVSGSGGGSEITYHSDVWLPVNMSAARKYTYSGWIYSDGPSTQVFLFMKRLGESGYFTYIDDVYTAQTGKWVYIEKTFMVPADVVTMNLRIDNNNELAGSVWFDDLRIQPTDSDMSTYTYLPGIGIASKIDNKGLTTYFEYDAYQRLKNVKDQYGNIVKTYQYNQKQ